MPQFSFADRWAWDWTTMIMQPDRVRPTSSRKRFGTDDYKSLSAASRLRLERSDAVVCAAALRTLIELVLGRVDRLGLPDDLARELLVVEVLVARRVRVRLRAVNGDHATFASPQRAQRQHLGEQTGDSVLVALEEPRDRRVIRALLGCEHPKRDVFFARPLDHSRGPDPPRVRIEQQRDHLAGS